MKSIYMFMLFAGVILASIFGLSQTQQKSGMQTSTKLASKPTASQLPRNDDDGQRLFEANCSRCHASPEGFSPRISGTIMKHMRVRASLSAHDEQELLRFFNP